MGGLVAGALPPFDRVIDEDAAELPVTLLGLPRLVRVLGSSDGQGMIRTLLDELASFTGSDWEQEDDITLVTLERSA